MATPTKSRKVWHMDGLFDHVVNQQDPEDCDAADNDERQHLHQESGNDSERASNESGTSLKRSKLRSQNADLSLKNLNSRYGGVKATRHDLLMKRFEDSTSDASKNVIEELSSSDVSDDDNDDNYESHSSENVSNIGDSDNSDDSEYEEEQELGSYKKTSFTEADNTIKKQLIAYDKSKDDKSKAIVHQLTSFEKLLELRIATQKSLIDVNKLPDESHYSWGEEEVKRAIDANVATLKQIVTDLLYVHKCTQKYSTTGNVPLLPGSSTLNVYEDFATTQLQHSKAWVQSVIQKWEAKTGSGSQKFSAMDQSIMAQIESILENEDRLIRRTQLVRQHSSKIGQPSEAMDEVNEKNSHLKRYDSNIFDDSDFYQSLLHDFIERKSAAKPGAQNLQKIQKLRSSMKKAVDTKASKGRKIRYNVHQKLVNFMPAISRNNDVKTDLFDSLFGKQPTNFQVKQIQ